MNKLSLEQVSNGYCIVLTIYPYEPERAYFRTLIIAFEFFKITTEQTRLTLADFIATAKVFTEKETLL